MTAQHHPPPPPASAATAGHWAQLEEAGVYWGMRLMLGAYAVGGRLLFRVLLYPVVFYFFLFGGRARRASLDYLRRLHEYDPSLPVRPTWSWSYRHFISFAETMLDKLAAWRHGVDAARVHFPNRPLLLEQLASGRGAVLLTGHVGNLEMCRALAHQRAPVRLTVLVHTRHAANFNRLLQRFEHSSKVELLQVTDLTPATAVELERRIAAGELVVITADRVPVNSDRVVNSRFLGTEAAFPQGPFILAALLRAPVYTLFCSRRADGYHIDVDKLCDALVLQRGQRLQALAAPVRAYSERLESVVRNAPLQWFNFYDFWTVK